MIDGKEHGPPAGQDLGKAMASLAFRLVGRRDGLRRPAGSRDAREPGARHIPGSEDDVAVLGPGAPASAGRIADIGGCSTAERHFFQLAAGEESHPLPVRRKERAERSLGSRERRGFELIDAAQVQLRRPAAVRAV